MKRFLVLSLAVAITSVGMGTATQAAVAVNARDDVSSNRIVGPATTHEQCQWVYLAGHWFYICS